MFFSTRRPISIKETKKPNAQFFFCLFNIAKASHSLEQTEIYFFPKMYISKDIIAIPSFKFFINIRSTETYLDPNARR